MLFACRRDRLAMCPHNAHDIMAERFDNLLDVQGDNRFIFDDQDIRRQRIGNRGAGVADISADVAGVQPENCGGLF